MIERANVVTYRRNEPERKYSYTYVVSRCFLYVEIRSSNSPPHLYSIRRWCSILEYLCHPFLICIAPSAGGGVKESGCLVYLCVYEVGNGRRRWWWSMHLVIERWCALCTGIYYIYVSIITRIANTSRYAICAVVKTIEPVPWSIKHFPFLSERRKKFRTRGFTIFT